MYFEPIKKTYYRFPSLTSVHDFDSKHYYPEKPRGTGEETRYENQITNHVTNCETNYNA
ncbi:MAG: hypothetical protein K0S01_475 [Herbinix sp.]|jgi:hypothetical protein|nr:hypothetical protein [Herbinix sp.]